MKKALATALVIVLILLVADAAGATEYTFRVPPHMSARTVFAFVDPTGKVTASVPREIQVIYYWPLPSHSGEEANTSCSITIREKHLEWVSNAPAGTVATGDGVFELSQKTTLATHTNSTESRDKAVVFSQLYIVSRITVKIKSLKVYDGDIDIGAAIRRAAGGQPHLYVHYMISYWCNNGDSGDYVVDAHVYLITNNLKLRVSTLKLWLEKIKLDRYERVGSLNTVLSFVPLYDLEMCAQIPAMPKGLYAVSVDVAARNGFNKLVHTTITLRGTDKACDWLRGIRLLPGKNRNVTVIVTTSGYRVPVMYRTDVPGLLLSIYPTPPVAINGQDRRNVSQAFYIYSVGANGTGRVGITWNDLWAGGSCTPQFLNLEPNKRYIVKCGISGSRYLPLGPTWANVVVVLNNKHLGSFYGRWPATVFSGSNIAQITTYIFNYAVLSMLAGAIVAAVLMTINYLVEMLTGRTLLMFNPQYLVSAAIGLTLMSLVLYFVIPYVAYAYAYIIHQSPMFASIKPPSSKNPSVVFSSMLQYYDKLFDTMISDYNNYVVGGLNEIAAKINGWLGLATYLFVIAAALAFSRFLAGAATYLAEIANILLGFAGTLIGIALMIVGGAGMVIVAIMLTQVFVLIATVLVLVLFALGVVMMIVPTPGIQRYGEELVGAGIAFLIILPILGPTAYGLYNYVFQNSLRAVSQSDINVIANIGWGAMNVIIPISTLLKIAVYTMAASIGLIILILSLGAILARAGVFAGLGEFFSMMVWR